MVTHHTQEKRRVNTDPFCTVFTRLDSIWYKYSAKTGPYLHGVFPVIVLKFRLVNSKNVKRLYCELLMILWLQLHRYTSRYCLCRLPEDGHFINFVVIIAMIDIMVTVWVSH